jgi:hypothetical protein
MLSLSFSLTTPRNFNITIPPEVLAIMNALGSDANAIVLGLQPLVAKFVI